MRRNYNMGSRGGNGGPLMTNHLHDLEMELELLKRKRQMVQQQQNEMLYRPNIEQAAYNQPRQVFEDRYDRFDRSHLYEEAPRAAPFAPRRRPVPVWDSAPGDGFGGPMVPNKKPRQGPFPPQHLMDNNPSFQQPRPNPRPSFGPKPFTRFQHPPQYKQGPIPRTFQIKFKGNVKPAPNGTPKKATPTKTPNKSPSVAPKPKKVKESLILTADSPRKSKVNGRLEFALGTILKDTKVVYKTQEHVAMFKSPPLARLIKQGVRERLRNFMMGKVVGTGQEVAAEYRKAFPVSTDVDIFDIARLETPEQDPKSELAIELTEEDDPELYFKTNMTKLLEVKLDEVFQKVEKYNEENAPANSEVIENLPEVKKAPTEESVKADEESAKAAAAPKHPKEEEYDKWISLLVARKLPELLAKRKNEIIKLLDIDQVFRTTKAFIVMNTLRTYKQRLDQTPKKIHNITYIEFLELLKDPTPDLPTYLHFVKLHANPAMPTYQSMQQFLKQFKPATIKRHKKGYNLMYLGFREKEDYERLLKADKTVIGTSTLSIVPNIPKQSDTVIEVKDDNDDSLEQVLTPQLDDQINDLLTSIRKADEDAKGDATNGDAAPGPGSGDSGDSGEREAEATNGNDSDVQEVKADAEVVAVDDDAMEADAVAPLKTDAAPATPAKTKAPATPSTIRTRASRVTQNN